MLHAAHLARPSSPSPALDALPGAAQLRLFYFLFLGAIGFMVSYFPLALKEQGMSMAQFSTVLLLSALIRIPAPALWGLLADKYQLTGTLLRLGSWGALLAYAFLLTGSFVVTAAAFMVFTFFRLPTAMLADTLAFRRVALGSGSYGGYRLWGTVGYVSATLAGGYLAERIGATRAVMIALIPLGLSALMTHRMPRPAPSPPAALLPVLKALLARRSVPIFLLAVALHCTGQSLYDNFFPMHMEQLGLPRPLIGWTVALGAGCEVAVMAFSGRLIQRFGATRLCLVGSAVAALRWTLNASIVEPTVLIALQSLHGVTFGAWFASAASWMNERAEEPVRASAQGLLSIACWGLGGISASALGATLADSVGPIGLFRVASMLSLVSTSAVLLCLWWERQENHPGAAVGMS